MLIGVPVLELTEMAGAMSFRPKLSRLLETLLMLRGAVFVLELELQVSGKYKYLLQQKFKNMMPGTAVCC